MKIAEIKKLNKEMLMQSENFEFFRALYIHCIKALEMVPEDFIKDVFRKTYDTESIISSISIGGKTNEESAYVRFEIYDKNDDDWKYCDYSVKCAPFVYRDVSVKIPLDSEEEDVVQFYVADSSFTIRDLKRTFGSYLRRFTNNEFYVEISTKCFD